MNHPPEDSSRKARHFLSAQRQSLREAAAQLTSIEDDQRRAVRVLRPFATAAVLTVAVLPFQEFGQALIFGVSGALYDTLTVEMWRAHHQANGAALLEDARPEVSFDKALQSAGNGPLAFFLAPMSAFFYAVLKGGEAGDFLARAAMHRLR